MNTKIVEFISDIDSTSYDEFKENATYTSDIKINNEINNLDYTILNDMEKYIPFISNIINSDYTNSLGNKIVLKSYENKFIKTLVFKLKEFLINKKTLITKESLMEEKRVSATIKSKIGNESITIDLDIKKELSDDTLKESYGLSLLERINRLLNIVNSLITSDFINQLEDVDLITDEVVKTEVFEQELNYKKCYELYELIVDYREEKSKIEMNDYLDDIGDNLLIGSFLNLQLLNEKKSSDSNPYKAFLERIIEQMVLESSMDEKAFKKMVTKKFEDEYSKKKTREKNIQNIFLKTQDNYNKQIKDALRALKN